jgi:V8-like Glu-specific endopeptidase
MRLRLRRPAVITVAIVTAAVVGVAFSPAAGSARGDTPTAAFGQTSTVGALFTVLPGGQLGTHFCTASVVNSPAGDLAVTAAHCMANRLAGQVAFVPDYADGRAPYGKWTVTKVIVDQSWASTSDPDDDFAFLVVQQRGRHASVQELVGGEVIGISEPAGGMVKVAGYPDDDDRLISCENITLEFSPTQYQFDCAGFTDGTSGSPLLEAVSPDGGVDTVIGVIGGYEQGGFTASVSYAAMFSTNLAGLYQAALVAAGR